MMPDSELLRRYAETGCEEAFAELVRRHLGLVYGAAVRQVNGDTHLAQDVAQSVFADLARKAAALSRRDSIAGWLFTSTHFAAAKVRRGERRRRLHEHEASVMSELVRTPPPDLEWGKVRLVLDTVVHQLRKSDRELILMRYFENCPLADIGQRLGLSEDAARKRVERALEKLRAFLSKRGVTTSGSLAALLSANAAPVPPAGLAAALASASLSNAAATAPTLTMLKLMATTKLKTALLGAIVVASLGAPLLVQQRVQAKVRAQDETLRRRGHLLAKLEEENERLSRVLARATNRPAPSDAQHRDLLRLRGQLGPLRNRARELARIAALREEEVQMGLEEKWQARLNRLRQWLEQNPAQKTPELSLLPDRLWLDSLQYPLETEEECRRAASTARANAEGPVIDQLQDALRRYAAANNGGFPSDLAQLRLYFDSPLSDDLLQRWRTISDIADLKAAARSLADTILQRWMIVPATSLVSELRPAGEQWVITERAAVDEAEDSRNAIGVANTACANLTVANRWVLLH